MPLSAAQTTHLFEILGVPQSGSGEIFASIVTLFGAEYESYDLSGVVSKINTKLAALTDVQVARVVTLLDRHTAITSSSPLEVRASAGASGTLADHPVEREAIRAALVNITGLAVPSGGFMAEAARLGIRAGRLER